jgi:hypothetical protein
VSASNSPILVTGAPRSGTTFLGRMLSLPRSVSYVDEPFNVQTGIKGVYRQFLYVGKKSTQASDYTKLVRELLAGQSTFKQSNIATSQSLPKRLMRRSFVSRKHLLYRLAAHSPFHQRYLVKDPMACFASEYLHRNLGMKTVVIIRHPASTVASYKRLGWRFALNDLTTQAELMQRHLEPVLGTVNVQNLTPVQEWSYLWLSIYTALDTYLAKNAKMLLVRHEDLSLTPLYYFEKLYEQLGLSFTGHIQHQIVMHTREGNPVEPPQNAAHVLRRNSALNIHRWKQILTPEEIAEVRQITEPFASRYYAANEW